MGRRRRRATYQLAPRTSSSSEPSHCPDPEQGPHERTPASPQGSSATIPPVAARPTEPTPCRRSTWSASASVSGAGRNWRTTRWTTCRARESDRHERAGHSHRRVRKYALAHGAPIGRIGDDGDTSHVGRTLTSTVEGDGQLFLGATMATRRTTAASGTPPSPSPVATDQKPRGSDRDDPPAAARAGTRKDGRERAPADRFRPRQREHPCSPNGCSWRSPSS